MGLTGTPGTPFNVKGSIDKTGANPDAAKINKHVDPGTSICLTNDGEKGST